MELFGGINVHGGTPEVNSILAGRSAFIKAYCEAKGWKEPLTMTQILEIRAQDGWKNPTSTEGK
jgi:hypothetical protein